MKSRLNFKFSPKIVNLLVVVFSTLVLGFVLTNSLISGTIFNKGPQIAAAVEAGYCESGWTFLGGDAGNDANWVPGCENGNSTTQGTTQGTSQGTTQGKVDQPQEDVWVRDQYGECDWNTHTVWDVEVNQSTGERRRTNIARTNAPECGYVEAQVTPTQTPAPQVAPQVVAQPAAPVTTTTQCTQSCGAPGQRACTGGSDSRQNGCFSDDSRCQDGYYNINGTCQVKSQAAPVVVAQGAPAPVAPAPIQQQAQAQTQTQTTQVTSSNSNVNTINVAASAAVPVVQFATAPVQKVETIAPRVVTVAGAQEVKELPKTGLPLVGWALMGLLPIGSKLRKFGAEKNNQTSANSIWEERQFSK